MKPTRCSVRLCVCVWWHVLALSALWVAKKIPEIGGSVCKVESKVLELLDNGIHMGWVVRSEVANSHCNCDCNLGEKMKTVGVGD